MLAEWLLDLAAEWWASGVHKDASSLGESIQKQRAARASEHVHHHSKRRRARTEETRALAR